MHRPIINIICCISKNRGIGKDNKLLFDIPEDLKHFKKITMGHPIIMGYNTFKSIKRPLPGRLNIVLSNDDVKINGCKIVKSISNAIAVASKEDNKEIFFIGGGMVYAQAIEFADRLYLTIVDAKPEADTFFPDYLDFTKVISEEKIDSKDYKVRGNFLRNYKYKFVVLERELK